MTAVNRSQRTVQTLSEVDPEFTSLIEILYGDAVDPQIVYNDVFSKLAPDSSDVNTKDSDNLKRRLAFAGTVAGGALGAKELITEVPKLGGRVGQAAGKLSAASQGKGVLIPAAVKSAFHSPKGRVAVAGTALGADVLAGSELKPNGNKKQPVDKASIGEAATAIRGKWNGIANQLIPMGDTPPAAAKAAKTAKVASNWERFGQGLTQVAGTTPGKVLIGAGALTAGAKGKKAYDRVQANKPEDPNAVGKAAPDVVWEGEFSKLDDDKQQAFGWASVISMGGLPVIDQQSDQIDEADLEDAAYNYVLKSRVGGHMHQRDHLDKAVHVSDVIESMVFTDEKVAKMGLPDSFPRGWWIGVQVHDPDVWQSVKKNQLKGFSIHGKGKRQDISTDDAMGY